MMLLRAHHGGLDEPERRGNVLLDDVVDLTLQ